LAGNNRFTNFHFSQVGSSRGQIFDISLTTATTPVSVYSITVDRLASAETDTNVALEADVVASREFESVEGGDKSSSFWMLCPSTEDGRISGTSIFVRNQMGVVVVSHGIAAAGKTAIDTDGLDFDFEHERVSDNSTTDFLSGRQADLHGAHRWRAGVGNGAGRRQHGDIESNSHGFLWCVVDAANLISLGFECHQFRMFLDDEDERGLSVFKYQSASVKSNLVIDAAHVTFGVKNTATVLIFGVSLDVKDAIETGCADVDVDLNAIGQTVDNNVRSGEVGTEWWWFRYATRFLILIGVSANASANGPVFSGTTFRVGIADPFGARIATCGVTVLVVWAVVIADAFR